MSYPGENATVTSEVEVTWKLSLTVSLMVSLMVTGIFGNLLVVVVYLRNRTKRQSTANYFLCSLAIVDVIVCVVAIPIHLHLEYSVITRYVVALECSIFAYVWHVVMLASAWMLVGIALDRYNCLCRPLNVRNQVRNTTRTIIAIWAASLIISVPVALFYDDQCAMLRFADKRVRVGVAVADSLVSLILPLAIISIAYSRIFYVVSRRSDDAQSARQGQRVMQHTRFIVAKRLLLVIAAFVVCWLPRTITEIYKATLHETNNQTTQAMYICQNIVPYFNSILNPILYSLINPRFRFECKRILYSCVGLILPTHTAKTRYSLRASSAFYY